MKVVILLCLVGASFQFKAWGSKQTAGKEKLTKPEPAPRIIDSYPYPEHFKDPAFKAYPPFPYNPYGYPYAPFGYPPASGRYPGPARYPVEEFSPKPTKKPHKEEPVHYTPEKCLYCPEAYKSDKKVTNAKDVEARHINVVGGIGGSFMAANDINMESRSGDGFSADFLIFRRDATTDCERSFTLGGLESCLEYLTFTNLLETVAKNLHGSAFDAQNKGFLYTQTGLIIRTGGRGGTGDSLPTPGFSFDAPDSDLGCDQQDAGVAPTVGDGGCRRIRLPMHAHLAENMVAAIEADSEITDYDWKLIFLMPLEQWLCVACQADEEELIKEFTKDVNAAINKILSMSKVILVAINTPDIGDIFDIEDCDFRGPPIFHPCPCLAGLYETGNEDDIDNAQDSVEVAQKIFKSIVDGFKNDVKDRKDAAVIYLDPFKSAKTMFPDKDSLADNCFNWGPDLTATAAALTWNALFGGNKAPHKEIDARYLDTNNIISGTNTQDFKLVCPSNPIVKGHY